MADPDAGKAGIEAARAYEELFVPALFGPWAPKVADAAALKPGERVLDVGCGTGVLAREALRRVGPAGAVTGIDPNPGMLAIAAERERAVVWRQASAESLPFPDGAFDAVMSQFALMFMEADEAIREMRRVLVPGGRLVVAVWDRLEAIPAYAAEARLVARVAGRAAAAALEAPFALGDAARLAETFARGGAPAAAMQTLAGSARFPSIRVMVEADLRGWLPVMGVNLSEDQIGRVLAEADEALSPFVTTPDACFAVSAHIVVS